MKMEMGFPSEADESVPTVVQGIQDVMGVVPAVGCNGMGQKRKTVYSFRQGNETETNRRNGRDGGKKGKRGQAG